MIDFFGEAIFILGSQFNQVNLFFINVFKSGSKGLNSVKNEDTLKSILTLGCCTVSLGILANHKIIYSSRYQILLIFVTFNFELTIVSQIRLNLKATPSGNFLVFRLGKHVEDIN